MVSVSLFLVWDFSFPLKGPGAGECKDLFDGEAGGGLGGDDSGSQSRSLSLLQRFPSCVMYFETVHGRICVL